MTEEPLFRMTRWGEGYDQDEVDAYVDRIQAAFIGRLPPPTVEEVRSTRFSAVRLVPGYRIDDVDAYLGRIALVAGNGWPRRSRGDGSAPEPPDLPELPDLPDLSPGSAASVTDHRRPGAPTIREVADPVVRELRSGAGVRVLGAAAALLLLVVLGYLLVVVVAG